jgi:hypothetical protein
LKPRATEQLAQAFQKTSMTRSAGTFSHFHIRSLNHDGIA